MQGLSQIQAVQASRGGVIQVQGGAIKTDDLLGKQYGSKVEGRHHGQLMCVTILSTGLYYRTIQNFGGRKLWRNGSLQ